MEKYTPHQDILREYDIRGTFEKTLHIVDAYWLGQTFGQYVAQHHGTSVVIGWDGRYSSPLLEEALTQGLIEQGIHVFKIGLVPTPLLYFAEYKLAASGGIMITGSHNPADQNGFKLTFNKKPFYGADIQALKKFLPSIQQKLGTVEIFDLNQDYIERICEGLSISASLSVAWDPGNGSTGEIIRMLIQKLPGSHYLINENIDGTFPAHHPDPSDPKNLIQLQELVRDKKCDIGIAFDGDGDRLGVIDAKGRILWGDQLLMIFAEYLLKTHPQTSIIADVKASQLLFDRVSQLRGNPIMWKTGHSYIKVKMKETGALLAGEMSGHFFFGDQYYGFDDGIYAALRLIDILSKTSKTLADCYDSLPTAVSTPEMRFFCEEDRKFLIPQLIKQKLQERSENFISVDGVRVNLDNGWWLLRASNTQAMLVARCESLTKEGLEKVKQHFLSYLKEVGIENPF